MAAKNKLLTVLSEAEQYALYGLPDFDDAQQLEYLALSETELMLATSRPGLHAQVYCILQIGYFKAKHTFFRFDWSDVIEVEQPVTRLPPHRSRRAELPHRALQNCSRCTRHLYDDS